MKRLICEMCGSADLIKQDGVFVCQFCGCKYSVEEARKMMIEGPVDVSGSTVHIDRTNEIDNLLLVARRARNEGNYRSAAANYEDVLKISPSNWEANFYRTYCSAFEGKIADMPNNLKMSTSAALSTINMLFTENPINEDACFEIVRAISSMVSVFFQNYIDFYSQAPEWVEKSFDQFGLENDSYVHNKGNYMRLQQNLDGIIIAVGKFYKDVAVLKNATSSFCHELVSAVDKERQELRALPQNPFFNAGFKYREFYNTLSAGNDTLFSHVNGTLSLITKLCQSHEDIEKEQNELKERQKQEEQKKKNAAYWQEHQEEKKELETNKNNLYDRIKELDSKILRIKQNISELSQGDEGMLPSQKEVNSLNEKVKQITEKMNRLGFFKKKEKASLQEEKDALTIRIDILKKQAQKEKEAYDTAVSERAAPLQAELIPLLKEKQCLENEMNQINKELAIDREYSLSESNSLNDNNAGRGIERNGKSDDQDDAIIRVAIKELENYRFIEERKGYSKTEVDNYIISVKKKLSHKITRADRMKLIDEISKIVFSPERNGYDRDAVDSFLDYVCDILEQSYM